jgi:hypothetical protein
MGVSMIRRSTLVLAALFLLMTSSASATPRAVPPGHSGASQYTETLPSAGGEQPTSEIDHGGPSEGSVGGDSGSQTGGPTSGGGAAVPTPTEALGAENARHLEKLGAEGKAAARLAASGGIVAKQQPGHGSSAGSGTSPVKQVVGELTGTTGSGGMGILLPLLIVMTVLIAAAFVFTHRRPAAPPE